MLFFRFSFYSSSFDGVRLHCSSSLLCLCCSFRFLLFLYCFWALFVALAAINCLCFAVSRSAVNIQEAAVTSGQSAFVQRLASKTFLRFIIIFIIICREGSAKGFPLCSRFADRACARKRWRLLLHVQVPWPGAVIVDTSAGERLGGPS
jgi:hypothetical protein